MLVIQAKYSCLIAKGDKPLSILASLASLWNADRAWLVRIAICCLKVRFESNQIPNQRTSSFGCIVLLFGSFKVACLTPFTLVKCISSVLARLN